ncbi:hypothetical protein [Rhizobium sp. AG207R]|uniref:hypothetical protein n=1 Tax=Rhizobium sp. AG207R TaxID=2802287 RepID=UPI0022AC23D3|nr:hypothetical protein [Rhizobium sp. AG207R]MCZ3377436.1 hypothetical protein [Rhizobium sp. AG207R]
MKDFSEYVELAKAKRKEIDEAAAEYNAARDLYYAAEDKRDDLLSDMGQIETDAAADGHLISDLLAAVDPTPDEQPETSSSDAS